MYNSTFQAGASRQHKHMHVIPYRRYPDSQQFPDRFKPGRIPFEYWLRRPSNDDKVSSHREYLLDIYETLFNQSRESQGADLTHDRPHPHNTMMTREWMMAVIPRRSNNFERGDGERYWNDGNRVTYERGAV